MTPSGPAAPPPQRVLGGLSRPWSLRGGGAAVADLPFVVGLDQHGIGAAEQGLGVGKDIAMLFAVRERDDGRTLERLSELSGRACPLRCRHGASVRPGSYAGRRQ